MLARQSGIGAARPRPGHFLLSGACIAPVLFALWYYPLPVWPLAAMVLVFILVLWRWPPVFLLVVPVVLPALDLGLWTGWQIVNEADLFVLATIAVLTIRDPPDRTDVLASGWMRVLLVVLILVGVIAVSIGLASSAGYNHLSLNPYLTPLNALRLAKGPAEALLLWPFFRKRQRCHSDAVTWFGYGMVAGLLAVTLIVLVERALFAGIFVFSSEYRVAGPFSSMHVGGGHIGAYTALALPFAFSLGAQSLRSLPLAILGGVGGTYTLIVTFARTGYAAGLLGCAVTGLTLLRALWNRGGRVRIALLVPGILIAAAVAMAASSGTMRQRLAIAATDLLTRESNWRAGWAVRDDDVMTEVLGMGLGTYQRTMLSRATVNRPSDFGRDHDDVGSFVWVRVESPFYLGQKVVVPHAGSLHLKLRFRGESSVAGISWSACDKVLLYSDNCQSGSAAPAVPGTWQDIAATMPVAGLGAGILGGRIHRPVEFSLFGSRNGTTIAIRDVSLTDDAGNQLLVNGDFRQGMDRWLFTDDSHVSWRILDQYLMLLFETGFVGLAAYLALAGVAAAGAIRAALRGNLGGAAVAGSVVSFLVSGLFDNVLEAPRIAALFFLICAAGTMLWEQERTR